MIIILNYRMNGTTQNLETVKAFFESIDKTVELSDGTLYAYGKEEEYTSDEPVEAAYLNKAMEDYRKLQAVLHDGFTLEGTIDSSSVSGEYMDFQLEADGSRISVQASDWYCETEMDSYEDYEDFCDSFFECSEEEYENFKECEFVYILETDEGAVLSAEIPMHSVEL